MIGLHVPLQVSSCPQHVIGATSLALFSLFCPKHLRVLPLFCSVLALESASNPFDDVLAMPFSWHFLAFSSPAYFARSRLIGQYR